MRIGEKWGGLSEEEIEEQRQIITAEDALGRTNSEERIRARKKERIIARATSLIVDDITKSQETLGLSLSNAVGQAMEELPEDEIIPDGKKFLPQSLDQILEEIEQRAGEVEKLKIGLNSALGKFITDKEQRIQAGIDSGDNEWEKYFYNRFQYAYAGFIHDYFARNRLQISACP